MENTTPTLVPDQLEEGISYYTVTANVEFSVKATSPEAARKWVSNSIDHLVFDSSVRGLEPVTDENAEAVGRACYLDLLDIEIGVDGEDE